jgi:hypothetical protein
MTVEDDSIADAIRTELEEGLRSINRAGFVGGEVKSSRLPHVDGVLFEIGGEFERCPRRRVYATVEIDPARIGWRLEAALWEYPDGDWTDHEVEDLGGSRVTVADSATQQGRLLATRAWVALRDYLTECPGTSKIEGDANRHTDDRR